MYQFVHDYGFTTGDCLHLTSGIASVGDMTLCCFFKPFDYGGPAYPGGASGAYPVGFAQGPTNFDGYPASPRGQIGYWTDDGDGFSKFIGMVDASGSFTTGLARPNRNVMHSLIIVRSTTTIKCYVDNVEVSSQTASTGAFLADHIRIGCIYDNVDIAFFLGQIGQWAFFKRAFTSGERATFHAARTSALNINAEYMWSLLGFDDTALEAYFPLVSNTTDQSGHAYATTVVGTPAAVVPTAEIDYAVIVPGGGDLLQIGLQSIATGSPTGLLSYSGGLTITPPGGSPQALNVQCATALTFLWAPLDPYGNWEQVKNDTHADFSFTGAWTGVGGFDTGLYGWHNAGDVNRFTRSSGNQHAYSAAPAATATWSFSSVPPGKYIVLVIYHGDTDRTSAATYTIKDGATTVGTFVVDQRQTRRIDTISPQNNTPANGRQTMILGPDPNLTAPLYTANEVTITTGTTVSIVLTNTAGSGKLVANLAGLRRVIQPYPASSVLNAPTGWCSTVAGDATALVNYPVGTIDINTFMPVDTTAPRTLKRGYNVAVPSYQKANLFYADRMLSAYHWEGAMTLDGLGRMTANSGTATRIFLRQPVSMTFEGLSLPMIKENGTWTLKYTIVSGTPVVEMEVDDNHGEILGTHSAATLVGGKMVRTVTLDTRGTVHPGNANLRVKVTGGAANVEVYGPEVPSGWTSRFHPAIIDWLKDRNFEHIRVDPQGINNYSEVEWADMPPDGKSSTLYVHQYRQFNFVSVGPVSVADLDAWFPALGGCMAVQITTSAEHGIRTGDTPPLDGMSDDGTGWATTGTPNGFAVASILRGSPRFAVRKDATHFLWFGFGPPGSDVDATNPARCITLTGSHSVTGICTITNGLGIPYADFMRLVNYCNVRSFWFNAPVSATDDFADQFGTLAATTLDLDKKLRVAVSNETWNNFQGQHVSIIWEHHTQWLWTSSGGTQGAPVGAAQGRAWLAWRTDQIADLIKAKFVLAGRPASDVIVVIETQLGYDPPTVQSLAYASVHGIPINEIAPATYRSVVSDAGNPPGFGLGYVTDISAGLAALSDASTASLVWWGERYGGMAETLAAYDGILSAYGFSSASKSTYEGGQDGMNLWSVERATRTYRHPGMYRVELAISQHLQNVGGLDSECIYQLTYQDGPSQGNQWLTYWIGFEDAGTGASSENQNPHDMRSGDGPALFGPAALSQTGGAHRYWSSAVTAGPSVITFAATTAASTIVSTYAAAAGTGGGGDIGWDEILPEPTAVPPANPTAREALAWLYMLSRNAIVQTNTQQTVKSDSGTTIGTAPVSDTGGPGGTFTRGKFS